MDPLEQPESSSGHQSFSGLISVPRCKICGGRSTGVHYGVISCEGCKAFFKRGISNDIKYKCYFGSTCPVTTTTRGRCKACRFKRCKEEGMDLRAMKGRAWKAVDKGPQSSRSPKRTKIVADDSDSDVDELAKSSAPRHTGDSEEARQPVVHLCQFGGSSMTPLAKPARKMPNPLINLDENRIQNALGEALSWNSRQTRKSSTDSAESPEVYTIQQTPPSSPYPGRQSVIMSTRSARSTTSPTPSSSRTISPTPSTSHSTVFDGGALQPNFPLLVGGLLRNSSLSNASLFTSSSTWSACERGLESVVTRNHLLRAVVPDLDADAFTELEGLYMPKFLSQYGQTVREKSFCLTTTVDAVRDALDTSFMDLIERCRTFRDNALYHDVRPYQPQAHLNDIVDGMRKQAGDLASRFRSFAVRLPGFSVLNADVQHQLLMERMGEFWSILHCDFYCGGEIYFLLERSGWHLSRYWLEMVMEPAYWKVSIVIMRQLQNINLTLVELCLLLCVALFNPDTADSVQDKCFLNLLYSHYLDALMHSISQRPEGPQISLRLEQFMTTLPFLHRLSTRYVLRLDLNNVPVMVRVDGRRMTFREVMAIRPRDGVVVVDGVKDGR